MSAPAAVEDLDDPAVLEAGRLLFAKECRFLLGVAGLEQLPPADLPEVAFAGRSNVGKSSLINALTGRKALARTSNTPGRTQQINLFDLDGRLRLADLPGYGYAKAPKERVAAWTALIEDYLRGRPNLRRACLLVDARHGVKDNDRRAMELLGRAAVVFQVVLTKADALKAGELAAQVAAVGAEIGRRPAAFPLVLATSASKGTGIEALRAALATLALPASAG